jgi:iron complex outermembrane receptor protein
MLAFVIVWMEKAHSLPAGDVVSQAEDAFGERIGTEQLGLYSESQVRGLSLQSAGNYRIDGHYFVRAAQLPDSVLSGVSIHVGTSALRTDFPSPAGVVGLRLKKAPAGVSGVGVETGFRKYETPFAQVDAWYVSDQGALSVAGGAYATSDANYGDGTQGDEYNIGAVPQWRVGGLTLTGLASWSRRRYNGDYRFVSAVDSLPPTLEGADLFGPPWARFATTTINAGLAAEHPGIAGWHLRGSTFLSEYDEPAADFTILETDATLRARATTSLIQRQRSRSVSSELSAGRRFALRSTANRIYATVRHRQSDSLSTSGETFELGIVDLLRPIYAPRPQLLGSAAYRETSVEQLTAGLGWELNVTAGLQARLGAQRSYYSKAVASAEAVDSAEDSPWLFDAAVISEINDNWLAYGSFTRGLQEQGVAPRNAVNRNEVLPVVEAQQIELGFKGRIADAMSLVAAVFEISKPMSGFDVTGRFGMVGDVRHRGFEVSLAGEPMEDLSLAAGVMALEPELSGPLVTTGQLASRPAGVQRIAAQLTSNYTVDSIPGFSIDVQLNHGGDRVASFDGELLTPARTTLNLGARYQFNINRFPVVLRMRIQNATDVNDWLAETSGLLSREPARTYMLSISTTSIRDPQEG